MDQLAIAEQLSDDTEKLNQAGQYSVAIPLAQKVLEIYEEVRGPKHADTAASLNRLAALYRATGNYSQAEPLYQRSISIFEETLGPAHSTAASMSHLAMLYMDTGAYAKAEPLLKKALDIVEKVSGPTHPDTAVSVNNLAGLYEETGAYAEAEPLLERALAIHIYAFGLAHRSTAMSLHNLGGLYQDTGAYERAESLYRAALAVRENTLGPNHLETAQSLEHLGSLFHDIGNYAEAEQLLKRALKIHEEVLGAAHRITALSQINLARLYQASEAYGEAERLLKLALATDMEVLGPGHRDTAFGLESLGDLYQVGRAYGLAEPLFQQALAIREQALGQDHPDTARSLARLARLYSGIGAYAQAEPLYNRALEIFEKSVGPGNPDTAVTLRDLALSEWYQGQEDGARKHMQRAMQIDEVNIRRLLIVGYEGRKRAYMETLNSSTSTAVSFSVAATDTAPEAKNLGLEVILQRKGRVLDVLANAMLRLRRSLSIEDQTLLTRYQAATRDWATLTMRGPGPLPVHQYRAQLTELQQQVATIEAEISSHSREFQAEVATIAADQVQRALPPTGVLLEWVRYKPYNPKAINQVPRWGAWRYAVYLLKPTGPPVLIDLGETQLIEERVSQLLAAVRHPGGMREVRMLAQALDRQLLSKVRTHLESATHLFISPDGLLNLLPFGMLQDATGQFLANQYDLTYLTSGRDLLRPATPAGRAHPMLVVADPAYDTVKASKTGAGLSKKRRSADGGRSGLLFERLGGTAEEARALRQLLHLLPSQVLTQGRATEAAIKQVHGPRILHLATHGFFLSDLPVDFNAASRAASYALVSRRPTVQQENPLLRSGLAFAGANQLRSGPHDDGILTALEVASLDLEGTELAVLSACETGVGTVQNGEGVYGLRRALVLAGVRTQVVSLWKVDDTATKEFMVAYYKQLQNGLGRSAALRAVQRAMRDTPARAHPYYWASFVVVGDPSPMPLRHPPAPTIRLP